MSNVSHILSRIDSGDPTAAEQLLPLLYDELRKLAAAKLSQEKPGQTLASTALVHEAYLRLVGGQMSLCWNSRGHFFAAAAEAMRRILVENGTPQKRGSSTAADRGRIAVWMRPARFADCPCRPTTCWHVDEALRRPGQSRRRQARPTWSSSAIFAGLTHEEAAARP